MTEENEGTYWIIENDSHVLGEAVSSMLDKLAINPGEHPRVYVSMVENHVEIGKIKGPVELIR